MLERPVEMDTGTIRRQHQRRHRIQQELVLQAFGVEVKARMKGHLKWDTQKYTVCIFRKADGRRGA